MKLKPARRTLHISLEDAPGALCNVCALIARVRADERERGDVAVEALGLAQADLARAEDRLTALRAQVEALRNRDSLPYFGGTRPAWNAACDAVLALLDAEAQP